MPRAVASVVVGVALVLGACSGGGADPITANQVCTLLAELARTGQAVERADITDPAKFDATLRNAVAQYVRTARRLRGNMPAGLRDDVDRLVAAAQQYRFQNALTARAAIENYAGTKCRTSKPTSTG